MIRLASTFLSCVFLLGGCSTATSQPSTAPRVSRQQQELQRQLHRNVAKADKLARQLRSLDDAELTGDAGRDSVIALARAQICVAVQTGSPQVAEHTVRLLEKYEQLHEEAHGKTERWGRHRIRVARRDAEIAADPEALHLQTCSDAPYRSPYRTPYRASRRSAILSAWGIDVPPSTCIHGGGRMTSSGVVR